MRILMIDGLNGSGKTTNVKKLIENRPTGCVKSIQYVPDFDKLYYQAIRDPELIPENCQSFTNIFKRFKDEVHHLEYRLNIIKLSDKTSLKDTDLIFDRSPLSHLVYPILNLLHYEGDTYNYNQIFNGFKEKFDEINQLVDCLHHICKDSGGLLNIKHEYYHKDHEPTSDFHVLERKLWRFLYIYVFKLQTEEL